MMTSCGRLAVSALFLCVLGAPSPAAAQGAPAPSTAPGTGEGRGAAGQLSPGEVGAMLDAYAAVQAQQALGLDDQRYPEFLVRLRKLQEAQRSGRQARARALQDLRKLVGDRAAAQYDEGAVRERLRALREMEEQSAAQVKRAAEAVDEVLDPRQQARFRLFEETIERRKLELVLRARQAARRDASRP